MINDNEMKKTILKRLAASQTFISGEFAKKIIASDINSNFENQVFQLKIDEQGNFRLMQLLDPNPLPYEIDSSKIDFKELIELGENATIDHYKAGRFEQSYNSKLFSSGEELGEYLGETIQILQSEKRKIEKEEIAEKVPEWIKQGEAYIFPEKHDEWVKRVNAAKEIGISSSIERTLELLEKIQKGESFERLYEVVKKEGYEGCLDNIFTFANNGPEFYEYVKTKDKSLSSDVKKSISEKKRENIALAKKHSTKIEFLGGGTLEDANKILRESQKRGENVYIDFNGQKLYSCDFDENKAYIQITGISKKDYEQLARKRFKAKNPKQLRKLIDSMEKIRSSIKREEKIRELLELNREAMGLEAILQNLKNRVAELSDRMMKKDKTNKITQDKD
ncbi:MAG: hypothetical protein J6C46_02950 [Clostridia bacterium]|nr:hypothetical protein [Clostridia bacterium]